MSRHRSAPATRVCADLCVCAEAAPRRAEAEALAARLGVELCPPLADWRGFALVLGAERLELRQVGPGAPGPIAADFGTGRRAPGRDLLRRALGAGHPGAAALAIDATAGLGRDSFALAALGYRVLALERSPLVAALLGDGLARATGEAARIAGRIELHRADGRTLIPQLARADLVLLDPMFPARGKSARKTKEMRAFRALVGDDDDAAELLAVARGAAGRRVVVKRPRNAAPLPGPAPSGSIGGTTVRFDLYPPLPSGG